MSLQDIIFLPNKETVLPNAVMNVFQLVLNFLYRLVYLCSDAIYRHAFARMKQRNRCCFGGRNPSGTQKIIEQQKMICGIARCKLCNILADYIKNFFNINFCLLIWSVSSPRNS